MFEKKKNTNLLSQAWHFLFSGLAFSLFKFKMMVHITGRLNTSQKIRNVRFAYHTLVANIFLFYQIPESQSKKKKNDGIWQPHSILASQSILMDWISKEKGSRQLFSITSLRSWNDKYWQARCFRTKLNDGLYLKSLACWPEYREDENKKNRYMH